MSELLRKLCLALGIAGILGGFALGIVWLRTPRAAPVVQAAVARPSSRTVLVAARPIAPGALLRDSDVAWRPLAGATPPAGAFVQGEAAPSVVVGAAARRGFAQGEILVSDAVVRPDQRDFLAATLTPGLRAVTIAVDAPQSASGLIQPGDRVDVVLVQQVGEGERRLAAETVLRNARVLAVGRNFAPAKAAPTGEATAPRTITLEAPPHDGERLFVAARLGELQLALRSVGDVSDQPDASPVWAGEVSGAARLRRSGGDPAPAPARPQQSVVVLRGPQSASQP